MEDETLAPPPETNPSDETMEDATDHNIHHSPAAADSDSEDSSGDDEAQEALEIETLETELATNSANYDAHVQYIRALRKKGEIEKLRLAREVMSELFPLSPTMWQEWAKDETSLTSGPESFSAIENLYERGLFDYLSVPLWCDYLNFVQEHDPSVHECSPEGISKARNLFERALTCAGMHVTEGSKIWEAYREFELAIFLTIDESDVEAKEKQVQRIRNLFHRQLSVPHIDLSSSLVAYKMWETEQGNVLDANSDDLDGISSHVATSYRKALEMLKARVHFEEQLTKPNLADTERLQDYMAYIKFEQSSGDPSRVQILYERAMTEFPLSYGLWLDYTRYLDKTLKGSRVVRDVYSRAVKNCSWVGELWARYLLSLERGHASEKEIAAAFEKSLLCGFSSFDEYLDIFLTRVDGIRRRIAQAGEVEDGLEYELIRETFQRASDYLSPHLKGTDSLLRVHSYWARLEINMGKDLQAARGVWESLLKSSVSMIEAWQGYIAMEIELGNVNEARSVYRRCYSKRFYETGSEDICNSWLRFEREFGSLEEYDFAVQKVTPRLEELKLFRLQQESKNTGPVNNKKEAVSTKISSEKRKQGPNSADEQPSAKRQKDTTSDTRKVRGKDKAKDKKSLETNKAKDLQEHNVKSGGANGKVNSDVAYDKPAYSDKCTAFVSNLSLMATYEDVQKFFSDVGGVVAMRIPKDKYTKKSRGLAYVDFSDDAHLTAAVAKNKQMLLGKKLSIARSDPNQRRKNDSAGLDTPAARDTSRHKSGQTSMSGKADSFDVPKGKNTFAVPRAIVRPLGWTDKNKPKTERNQEQEEDLNPKSNDEFRKMLLER